MYGLKTSSESVEGKQIIPKLLNKAFSAKSTQYIRLKRHEEPYNTYLSLVNELAATYLVYKTQVGVIRFLMAFQTYGFH